MDNFQGNWKSNVFWGLNPTSYILDVLLFKAEGEEGRRGGGGEEEGRGGEGLPSAG